MVYESKKDGHFSILIFSFIVILLFFVHSTGPLLLPFLALYGLYHYKLHFEWRQRSLRIFTVSLFYFLPILLLILSLSALLLSEYPQQEMVSALDNSSAWRRASYFVGITILSPIIEEITFRVIIYKALKYYLGIFPSLFFSSLLFASIHQNILALPTLFLIGCYFSFLYQKYNTVIYPILAHSIFNLVMGILITI